ncbi:MAG: ATPase, T2SS/T4P/T4SS family [Planctomycetes bacterium]|nr:ATPase, T2SS/T4P/T4SS family [Planctomycetota bacterium]
MARQNKAIGQILKEMELVTEANIQEALVHQKSHGGSLGQVLVELGKIAQADLSIALAAQQGMDFVDIDDFADKIDDDVLSKVPPHVAESYNVFPLRFKNRTLQVAISDPEKLSLLDELRFLLPGVDIRAVIADENQIAEYVEKHYGSEDNNMGGSTFTVEEGDDPNDPNKLDIESQANAGPIVTLVNQILHKAIQARAADIHLEPFEKDFKVRMRIDGVLYEMISPPTHLAPVIVSRIKVLSKLNIAETRLPQDGRIELTIAGRPIDLRVSTLPTMWGESCVMRILDRTNVNLNLENVGLRKKELELARALIQKPNGIILVTGPTGSGKTTTLYSALTEINTPDNKIITTEDPVEYNLDGIVQVQIQEEIGLTYSRCLRSILRQDPDVILVGEIRDKETAIIAIEASLTGHLVLSTLHTNDAPSSITRLIDVGIESFLIAATLEAIIAQRLVRRICPHCRETFIPKQEQIEELGLKLEQVKDRKFCYGRGCEHCNNTGYRGRVALYEILLVTDGIRDLILENASTDKLRRQARMDNMKTLREAGISAILDGTTTIEEVVRETLYG